jgi:hypothetical protein
MLLSTIEAKLSLTCDGSRLTDLGGALAWDALDATSDVTLTTAASRAFELTAHGLARSGPPQPNCNIIVFQYVKRKSGEIRGRRDRSLFCPAARFAAGLGRKTGCSDCLTGIRPILKHGFTVSDRRTSLFWNRLRADPESGLLVAPKAS